jgi:DNA-binding transcriptional regulator GbsR (MarR family)
MRRDAEYLSFLLRFWRLPSADKEWLVQVEFIPGGKRRYFSSVKDLCEFILAMASEPEEKGGDSEIDRKESDER